VRLIVLIYEINSMGQKRRREGKKRGEGKGEKSRGSEVSLIIRTLRPRTKREKRGKRK